jgi:hypothetical protein
MCTPLGSYKTFISNKAETVFNIREDEKRIYFCLGSLSRLDSTDNHWPRIKLTIEDHLKRFPETTFIYFGWEVLDYFDKLKEEYPNGKYFGFYINEEANTKSLLDKTLLKLYDLKRDETVIRNRFSRHYTQLEMWYNEGEPKVTILNEYDNNKKRCFFIN